MAETGFSHRLTAYKIVGHFIGLSYRKISGSSQVKNSFFRISNISVPCPHAQLRCRTVIKELYTFFKPWGRDRSQSPPCWIFRVKQIHPSTASASDHSQCLVEWGYVTLRSHTKNNSCNSMVKPCYRRSLAVSSRLLQSVTISSVYVVILGVCLRFKPHWMFQIYKYIIKGHEELTSCSSVMHSYLFPLLDVLYRQVGNLSFWQWIVPNFVMAASNHILVVAAIQGAGNTMISAWDSELIYLSDLSYQRKQASCAVSQLSNAVRLAGLETHDIQGISLFKIVGLYAR